MLEAFEEILVGKVRVADRLVLAVPRLADYRSLFESAVRRRSAVPALFRRGSGLRNGAEYLFRILHSSAFEFLFEFALLVEPYRKAGVLPCIRGFKECQQSPRGDHTCSSRRYEREGDAGQREQVYRSEHVEYCLEDEHRGSSTGCDAVIRGSSGDYRSYCKDAERYYAEYCEYRYYQSPFFTEQAEYQVSAGGSHIAEVAFACAQSRQSAAGGSRHRLHLLETAACRIVPHVAPRCKTRADIRFESEHHEPHQTGSSDDQYQL